MTFDAGISFDHRRRPALVPEHGVDLGSLGAVRQFVDEQSRALGLAPESVDDFVLAANELATNVVRHGGGRGRVWVWCVDGVVFCQMTDRGPGMADTADAGEAPSAPTAMTGRGFWMIRRMTDRMSIETGPSGTTVTVAIAIAPAVNLGLVEPREDRLAE